MSSDPKIECPNCGTEIKLNESLAAPLIAATKKDYENRLAKQTADFTKREQAVKEREAELAREIEAVDSTVADKVKVERKRIAIEEAKKAKLALGDDLEERDKALAELTNVLKERDKKLADAQKAQADLVRKERELEDARREIDLTIEKRVTASVEKTRVQAKKEAQDEAALQLVEQQNKNASLTRQIDALKKKIEQGSQQLQGEALELQMEAILAARFPHDTITPVPKGEHGGDILQSVVTPGGISGGTILWESKRTKNWSDTWLPKLREDQRQAKAEIAVIVSAALPKGVEIFDQIDGVWVVSPRCVIPVAMTLRQTLIEVQAARQAGEGQQTKTEMVYHYLTGPKFRLRVQAIVEAFTELESDLAKEKKAITRQWAKRETQITRVMEATVGMYGELQGIAGQTLQEIEGLDLLDSSDTSELLE